MLRPEQGLSKDTPYANAMLLTLAAVRSSQANQRPQLDMMRLSRTSRDTGVIVIIADNYDYT